MNTHQFVDHHAHFITAAAEYKWPNESDWFRLLASRNSNPMDDPWPGRCDNNQLQDQILSALNYTASLGLTRIVEVGIPDLSTYEALLELRSRGPLPVKVEILLASGLAEQLGPTRVAKLLSHDPWLDVIGVKFYSDGWLSLRNCALREPFVNSDNRGILFLDAETIARRASPFAEAGLQIATHAIGDRAMSEVLRAYEIIYGGDYQACKTANPRIEHAIVLAPDLVAQMAQLGVTVCIQPSFAHMDEGMAEDALGHERAKYAYGWADLFKAGVRVIAGSDAPVADPSPLTGFQRLVECGLTVEQALAIMTNH